MAALVKKVADRMKVLGENPLRPCFWASAWAAANWLLDATSLWVFLFAFGAHVSPIDLLVAYGLANILAVIPITPGGLGVVEFISISTLPGFGVAGGAATAGVLCWRLVNFWLPIPFGGIAYLSLWRGGAHAATSTRTPGESRQRREQRRHWQHWPRRRRDRRTSVAASRAAQRRRDGSTSKAWPERGARAKPDTEAIRPAWP